MTALIGIPPAAHLHPSWIAAPWPEDLVPVPLDAAFRPLDQAWYTRRSGAANQVLFVAPAASALRPGLAEPIRHARAERPDVGIFYADEAVTGPDGAVTEVHCKPAFNPALMLAANYMGFPLLIRADVPPRLVPRARRHRRDAAWYGLCLDALAAGINIDRIPVTLIASPAPRPRARRRGRAVAAARWLADAGLPSTIRPGLTVDTLELRRRFASFPAVTLVVPTRQGASVGPDGSPGRPHVADLLDSIGRSTYPKDRIRVLIGDDSADDELFSGRDDPFSITRLYTAPISGRRFNYAAKMNRLWRAAETELVILLNDDVVVRSPGWIEALLTYAMDPGVGGVGARLLFPDGTIQHAGMVGGLHGVFGHPWYRQPGDAPSYADWAVTQRDCSAVTGAVYATRRAVLEAVDGFDEDFSLDFNDVDLCLRTRMLGFRIVYTPFAVLEHHEKASRSIQVAPGREMARFLRRWRDALADDPMFSPQLRTDTEAVTPRAGAARWVVSPVPADGEETP